MRKTEKIKKYLRNNPLADEKRIAKKFQLSVAETTEILKEMREKSKEKNEKMTEKIAELSNKKTTGIASFINERIIQTNYIYLFIFVLAAILRIFYSIKLNSFPQLNIQILDAQYYVDWAKKIADGNLIGDKIFFTEPFYAYFLALMMKISSNALLLVKIFQMLIGSLLPIIIMKIGEKVFNRNIGILSGIIVAIYGPFIFYENLILKTSLEIFSLALFVWFLLFMIENNSRKVYLAGGLLLGIVSLIKGNNLILFPAVLLLLSFSKNLAKKEKIVLSLFFTIGLILTILPVTIRNYVVGKDFVPTNYSIGIVTYQGNWWGTDGSTAMVPSFFRPHPKYEEIDARGMAESYANKPLAPSKISRFWITKAVQESLSDPIHTLKTSLKKVLMILNWHELSDDYSYDFYAKFIKILQILPGFLLISSLGLAGIFLIFFSKDLRWNIARFSGKNTTEIFRLSKILITVMFVYILVLIIANINSRYRTPLVPFFAIFSSVTLWYVWLKIKEGSNKMVFSIILLVLIGVGISMAPLRIYSSINEDANAYHQIGSYYLENKDYVQSKDYFEKTIEMDNKYAWAYKNLFTINMISGDLASAEKNIKDVILIRSDDLSNYESLALLKKAQEKSIDSVKDQINDLTNESQKNIYDPYSYEATRYIAKKNNKKAEEFLLKSLDKFDNPPNSLITIASLKRSDGSIDEAIKYLSMAIEKNPYLLPARYNLANIYIEQKNYISAIPQLKQIYDIVPELGQVWSNLAIAYINTKNYSSATPIITGYVNKYKDDPEKKEMVDKFNSFLLQDKSQIK